MEKEKEKQAEAETKRHEEINKPLLNYFFVVVISCLFKINKLFPKILCENNSLLVAKIFINLVSIAIVVTKF